jgi:hypothetical protein
MKVLAVLVMFLAESLCILGENMVAGRVKAGQSVADYWPLMLVVTILWGVALSAAYGIGMKAFGRIWTVSVVSLGAIVIAEPTIVWLYWHEAPSHGEVVGLLLGFAGMLAALL